MQTTMRWFMPINMAVIPIICLNRYIPRGHKKFDAGADEMFQWVFDLKDADAQKVANHFAAQLARVGLDESEWLRRSSG